MRVQTTLIKMMLGLLLSSTVDSALGQSNTAYPGGRSTVLKAMLSIANADKIPMGIVVGINATALCAQEQDFRFNKLNTLQALQEVSERFGYTVTFKDGVYQVTAPDVTRRESEVISYKFESFYAPPTTMSDLGARLTGYIIDLIEGAGSFMIDTIGSTDDEIIAIDKMSELSAPQIANRIVTQGSKGLWIMQAVKGDKGPKPGSTIIKLYSYHDAANGIRTITCPTQIIETKP